MRGCKGSVYFHRRVVDEIVQRETAQTGDCLKATRKAFGLEKCDMSYGRDCPAYPVPDAWNIDENGPGHLVCYEVENINPLNDESMRRYQNLWITLDGYNINLTLKIYDRYGGLRQIFEEADWVKFYWRSLADQNGRKARHAVEKTRHAVEMNKMPSKAEAAPVS